MDLGQFSKRMKQIASAVSVNSEQAVKDIGKAIIEGLAEATPCDEGTAISNWQASINTPKSGVISAYSIGKKQSTRSTNISSTVTNALGIINTFKSGRTIYLANNLQYIAALNDGHSTQAPKLFVQTVVNDKSNYKYKPLTATVQYVPK